MAYGGVSPSRTYGATAAPAEQAWNPSRAAVESGGGVAAAVGPFGIGNPLAWVVVIGILYVLASRHHKGKK